MEDKIKELVELLVEALKNEDLELAREIREAIELLKKMDKS